MVEQSNGMVVEQLMVWCMCVCAQLCLTFCDPMDCSPPDSSVHGIHSSVHGILQEEYWSGLPFPPPGDLPSPGIEHGLLHLLH